MSFFRRRPRPPLRLVAITRLLDEADIIEAFVRHTAHYVRHHVFIDNGSTDGTLEILRSLKQAGFGLTVFSNHAVSFHEVHFNTSMFFHAAGELGADWVLCLDCDEFVDDASLPEGLVGALERLRTTDPDCKCLRIPVVEFVRCQSDNEDEPNVPLRIRHRLPPNDNTKIFIRADLAGAGTTVGGGNHFVFVNGQLVESRSEPHLFLGHFSTRSSAQLAAKAIKGWAKVLAAGADEVARGTSSHYRPLFQQAGHDRGYVARLGIREAGPAPAHAKLEPLLYRGSALEFTGATDHEHRAVRSLLGYLEQLACRHGRLLDEIEGARSAVATWDGKLDRLI